MVIVVVALLAGGLFWLQKRLYQKLWLKGLLVKLMFEEELVAAGEYVNLLEIVENRKRLPLPSLKVKFQCSKHLKFADSVNSAVTDRYYRNDLFSVMPYKRITRKNRLYCPKRGYYTIHGIDLVGADLFFSGEMLGSENSTAELYVIPSPVQAGILDDALRRINGEIAVKRYELEDPFTYQGIREYQPHDEMKSINWKATARTGELKVNRREHTAVKTVRIFMNLEDNNILRREELLELCISICARLVKELLAGGIRLAIYANAKDCISGQILQMKENSDIGGITSVYKALARLDLEKPCQNFTESFREKLFEEEDLYTIFLASDRHDDFQELLCEYSEKEDFTWICPMKKLEEESIKEEIRKNTILIEYKDKE